MYEIGMKTRLVQDQLFNNPLRRAPRRELLRDLHAKPAAVVSTGRRLPHSRRLRHLGSRHRPPGIRRHHRRHLVLARLRLVDRQATASVVLVVQGVDGRHGIGVAPHLDEAEPAAPARLPVDDYLRLLTSPNGANNSSSSASPTANVRLPTYSFLPTFKPPGIDRECAVSITPNSFDEPNTASLTGHTAN